MGQQKYSVAVIGGGGRESALISAYSQSPNVDKLLAIPGNDFMLLGRENLTTFPDIKTTDVEKIVEICQRRKVSFVDVAQDNAVAAGLVNKLSDAEIPTIGPTQEAGEIEWDKAWSREAMTRWGIPQPEYRIFTTPKDGINYLKQKADQKWFVKASGLAEGKGALPAKSNSEALERIKELAKFGNSSDQFLLEEWLEGDDGSAGEEFSAFAVSDGKNWQLIGYAQDHKRALDNDQGENTGGMGCVSNPLIITENIDKQTKDIFSKTFDGLQQEGRPYKGILYFGGMAVKRDGQVKVYGIEFNGRWGDPEAEVIIPGIQNDLLELGLAVHNQTLDKIKLQTDGKTRVSVALTAEGYPGEYSSQKGKMITGIEEVLKLPNTQLFGAGIRRDANGGFSINGGRVLHVVGEGENISEARENAYKAASLLGVEGSHFHYRRDIGWRDVERLENKS